MGLFTSDEEITTNLIPFDINIYRYEEASSTPAKKSDKTRDGPYKKINRVTVKIPNDVLPTNDVYHFNNIVRPLSYNVVGKDQLSCCIYV